MNKFLFITLTISFLTKNGFSSEVRQNLKINIAQKYDIAIAYNARTTILQIKEQIEESEGIPVNSQQLFKYEKVKLIGIPVKEIPIELENDKTCNYYDLNNILLLNYL